MHVTSALRGGAVIVTGLAAMLTAVPAGAGATTVCPSGCAFSQLQPAVDAAHPGDTITIASGTYAGGVRINTSLTITGAGPGKTVISGGGPVITVGEPLADTEPTVSITGLTITGGVTHRSDLGAAFGQEHSFVGGGGVEIPPNADFSGGATVTMTNVAITGNRVDPTDTIDSGLPCPTFGDGECPFALAAGGAIDSWGSVRVVNSALTGNLVGTPASSGGSSVASDANGGAVMSWLAGLSITNTVIADNRAGANAPNGRFADSGAVFAEQGSLSMTDDQVLRNSARLDAALPNDAHSEDSWLAIAGGIHIGGGATGRVSNTTIAQNSVTMTNSAGDSNAFSGGLHSDVDISADHVVITNNAVTASTTAPAAFASADSGGGELSGSFAAVMIRSNSVAASSASGDASASAGGSIFCCGPFNNGVISGNTVVATAPHGDVTAAAGGVEVGDSGTSFRSTTIRDNSVTGHGLTGTVRGGGVFDAPIPNGPPGGPLVMTGTTVAGNAAHGDAGLTVQGGGIYASGVPVRLTSTTVSGNTPDQCFGC